MPEIAKVILALVLSAGFFVVFLTAPPTSGLGRARDELAKGFKELAGGMNDILALGYRVRSYLWRPVRPRADLSWLGSPYAGRDSCYGCGSAPTAEEIAAGVDLAPYMRDGLTGEPLVEVTLVPVEVFGTECDACGAEVGYGLSDAVEPWSDCNRARGHIFRRDDIERDPDNVITVYVPESEMAKFEKHFGDEDDQ